MIRRFAIFPQVEVSRRRGCPARQRKMGEPALVVNESESPDTDACAFAHAFEPYADRFEPARVAVQHRNAYVLYTAHGETDAVLAGRVRHRAGAASGLPAVGDWVAMERKAGKGPAVIHATLPRHSQFVRKVAGRGLSEQVLAANVDVVLIVAADLNVRRLERYLALARDGGAEPVLVLTKADLWSDAERLQAESVMAIGVPVVVASAVTGEGLDALRARLRPGCTIALLGTSGAGKSTLINALIGEARLRTGEVRSDGKGRHTTTHRELVPTREGALLLDTPGLRELQLWTGEQEVEQAFDDIGALAADCRFGDCHHATEPDCAVRQAVRDGRLDAARLASFHKLAAEVRRLEALTDRQASLGRKRSDKAANRALRAQLERKKR
jgi:ribosome biogenesis GTPase